MLKFRAHYTSDIPEVDKLDSSLLLPYDVLLNELGELVIEFESSVPEPDPPEFPHYSLSKFYELP